MKKPRAAQGKLIVNVEFDDPLKSLLLREAEKDERTMAGMIRVICKRYFAEQIFADSTHQYSKPAKEKIGKLPYYPDELPPSKQGEGG